MKNEKQLKKIIKIAIQQYLEQSGLSKIILQSYKTLKTLQKAKKNMPPKKVNQEKKQKIKNLLQKNKDIVEKKRKSKLRQMKERQQIDFRDFSESDQNKPKEDYNSKILQSGQRLLQEEDQDDQVIPIDISRIRSQKVQLPDSILTAGQSLPDFLKKSIAKMKSSG